MIEGRIMWVVGFFVPRFYDIPTFTHTLSTPPPTMDRQKEGQSDSECVRRL